MNGRYATKTFFHTYRWLKPTANISCRYATNAPESESSELQLTTSNLNPHHPPADDRLKRILWNLHPLTILERGLVSDHSGERHIECVTHINNRFFIEQDRLDEVVGQLPV